MKQEEKDLLLKDLCARLPYGVKCKSKYFVNDTLSGIIFDEEESVFNFSVNNEGFITQLYCHEFKPYLFPMSSMTAEQEMECQQIKHSYYYDDDSFVLFDWYDKNHIDYRGLIPMGLAIDATGLNIY